MTGKWQPIETAPKDGTPILLGGGHFVCEVRGSYDEPVRHAAVAAWWKGTIQGHHKDGGWLIASKDCCYYFVVYEKPTKWMPLPEPPRD